MYKKLLKMTIDLVDFPIDSMVDLSICKCLPEGKEHLQRESKRWILDVIGCELLPFTFHQDTLGTLW